MSSTVCRGDIWVARLGCKKGSSVQHGSRPVIVISNNLANRHSPTIHVIPITTSTGKRDLPVHVFIRCPTISSMSIALVEQLTALDKETLCRKIGEITQAELSMIEIAMKIQFDLT